MQMDVAKALSFSYSPTYSSDLVNFSIRSTRGASKQRRDQINSEIQKLRDLLPISQNAARERLFQLQVMSLACTFIRKHQYFQYINQAFGVEKNCYQGSRSYSISKALCGQFLLMFTPSTAKLIGISDNATHILGQSLEEIICQGDSLLDLIDPQDHPLVIPSISLHKVQEDEEKVFCCRMNIFRNGKSSSRFYCHNKLMLMTARLIMPATASQNQHELPLPLFVATCKPVLSVETVDSMLNADPSVFQMSLGLDMKILQVDEMTLLQLGRTLEELIGKTFYEIVHPEQENLEILASAHKTVIEGGKTFCTSNCVFRLLNSTTSLGINPNIWVYCILSMVEGRQLQDKTRNNCMADVQEDVDAHIKAIFQILSEKEACAMIEADKYHSNAKYPIQEQSSQTAPATALAYTIKYCDETADNLTFYKPDCKVLQKNRNNAKRIGKKRANCSSSFVQYPKQEINLWGRPSPSLDNALADLNNNQDLMENLETSFDFQSQLEKSDKHTAIPASSICSSLDSQELLLPPSSNFLYCPTLWADFEKGNFFENSELDELLKS